MEFFKNCKVEVIPITEAYGIYLQQRGFLEI